MTAYELRISDWSSDVCSSDLEEFADDPEDEEIVAQIRELIDTRVRPAVANDGGDIIYRGFDKGTVYLRMQGACSGRSEEHTSELQSLMRISYAVFCLKKKKQRNYMRKKHALRCHRYLIHRRHNN